MDRLDAMRVFVTVLEEGSLAGASRTLRRSPAAISRAIAFLEAHVGTELLHRTTRSLRLSEAGQRYAAACRRILVELEEADLQAAGERAAPRGLLTVSAPPVAGQDLLRPVVGEYLGLYPEVAVRLLLLDRPVNLVEEGVDVALRVGALPDSSLIATRVGGDVRRVVVGAPAYLARRPPVREPPDLRNHDLIAFSNFGLDSWSFPPSSGSSVGRTVQFVPRLTVNTVQAALASAIDGTGITRLYSYHVADAVQRGQLTVILGHAEFPALPVHLLTSPGRVAIPKVRAFLDLAAPRLRDRFARLAVASRDLA
jgi:DNA-binding transcriptional LysR family regulator